ncbi:hypothetical protein CLV59_104598 [Chitinophaga dinghuensis]|uniref:DUF6265 domain-containing protein n=1 Tax=Chitinophaga dinghuensis TaxID=1539050 RepID=A0A327VZ64_9BACT|nr:DUF6265 family protein [Chitinophaga dinghuensis]RAJ82371.1 hypothetical protein CLV59_104598 [Chitinophaga dinghuensis]
MVKMLLWSCSCMLLLIAGTAVRSAAQVNTADFKLLDKLAGTWTMNTKLGSVVEQWQKLNDSSWMGRTWRIAAGDSSLQQTIHVVKQGDAIYFIPDYAGKQTFAPVKLKLRVLKAIGFVAEDLHNDFPQKVTYRFTSVKILEARVQGTRDGTIEEYIFKFNR